MCGEVKTLLIDTPNRPTVPSMDNRRVKVWQVKPKGLGSSFRTVTLSHVNSEWFTLELNSGPPGEKAYDRLPQLYTNIFKSFKENLFVASVTFDRTESLFKICCFFLARQAPPQWVLASSFTRFLDHTQRRTTVSRTPLDEWSARRRDLYLTTHTTLTKDKHPCPRWDSNLQSQQTSGRRPTP